MNTSFLRHLQLALAALDLLALNAVFFICKLLFNNYFYLNGHVEYTYFQSYLSIAWLAVVLLGNIYHEKFVLSFELFTKRSMHSYVYFLVLVIFYLFFFRQLYLSRVFVIVVLFTIPLSLMVNRFLYLAIYQYFKKRDYLINRVIVIGYNNLSKKLVSYLEEEALNKEVVGFCEEFDQINELSNYPILSNISGAMDICKKYGVTEIYSTIDPEHHPLIYQIINKADQNCIRFKLVPDIGMFIKRQVHIEQLNQLPVISLRKEPLEDLDSRIRKRLFDIVVSSLVLVFILSWLIPLLGLLIWIESKGPVFFIQQRSGKDNKNFPCFKFRSMVKNGVQEQQASKNDARVTKIGRFLRRTSLDEFPQFLNVLKGDMSIVGPRPHMVKHTDKYSQLIDQYMVRQFLKPGITSWAQVNGFRGETKTVDQMEQRVEHDIWYMENWNFWLDIKIVYLTVYNTLKGQENAF